MNRSKTIAVAVAAVVLGAALFGGGYLVATKAARSDSSSRAIDRFGANGPFAQLTDSERQQLQNMTAEERQKFFADKGIQLPQGGSVITSGGPGPGGMGARTRGASLLEGTVASVSGDTVTIALTAGGSATVYVDTSTVKAAVSGARPDIVQGARVYVYSEPEARGVTAAKAVIVR